MTETTKPEEEKPEHIPTEKDEDYWGDNGVHVYENGSYETKEGEYYDAETDELHIPF